ncbi:MAG: hypothetical protein HZA77_02865 [Candidatus Schekmanbacteria bacterium]|nr:hypothetical protein [Candidatus Schekmanbacteria bacterium]
MANPVEKIKETIDEILDSVENEIVTIFNALFGKLVSCFLAGVSVTTAKEFLDPRKGKKSFLIDLNTNEEIKGDIFICLDHKEACWVSAIMNGLAESMADEKEKSGQFDENDIDAVSEVGNQLAGKLNFVLKPIAKKKLHFIKTRHFLTEEMQGEDNKIPLDEEETVIIPKFSFSSEGKEIGFIYVMFPVNFASLMVGIPLSGDTQEKDNESESAKLRKIILLCQQIDSKEEALYNMVADKFSASFITCKLNSALEENPEIKEADLIFVDSYDDPNSGIDICKQLIALKSSKKKSIILSSKNITKDLLLQAISTGICDIIVKPASTKTIMQKVQANIG